MSEEQAAAAQIDPLDAFVQESIDQDSQQVSEANQTAESAPVQDAKPETPETTEAEKPAEDGFQKRINKVTADKYAQERRANDLQARIDKLEAAQAKPELSAPTLGDADIDYDEDKLSQAQVAYQIQEGVKSELERTQRHNEQAIQQAKAQEVANSYTERVTTFNKPDFDDKANAIPELPTGVAQAVMQLENGPEVIYHLGQHLDTADSIAKMSPIMAMMEIGKLTAKLSAKPEFKQSAAPDPIEPLSSGSAMKSEIGDEMSINDWMKKYN